MTKIVYNKCFGGFSLSHKAMLRWAELRGIPLYAFKFNEDLTLVGPIPDDQVEPPVSYFTTPDMQEGTCINNLPNNRSDPLLIQVVEELGATANGPYAQLAIIDLPPGTRYRIEKYDGVESVMCEADYEWFVA